jgi:hypothetical protein
VKRWQFLALVGSVPLILAGVVFQAGRYSALAAEARLLEEEQRAWVDANGRLLGSIAVLESRERAAEGAKALGLVRAEAGKRIFLRLPAAAVGLPRDAAGTAVGPGAGVEPTAGTGPGSAVSGEGSVGAMPVTGAPPGTAGPGGTAGGRASSGAVVTTPVNGSSGG